MRVLVTGGAGFIGSHLVEHILKNTSWDVVVLDKLTYASYGFERLRDTGCLGDKRLSVLSADIVYPIPFGLAKEIGDINYIFHLAAETHVDNSITNPEPFVMSNVVGTMRVLDYAKTLKNLKKMVYFSTDEVFGSAVRDDCFREWDRYNATNPYSASKAGGEELCIAYENTYKVPVIITHCMNAFGERQHPEKFIPSTIKKVLSNGRVIIHASKYRKSGSRFYIHCRNISAAVLFLLDKGENGDKYNIVGEKEVDNLELAKFISKVTGKPLDYEITDYSEDRPGHDLRYCLDGSRMITMGWTLPKNFEESLEKTIRWYTQPENRKWLDW